MFAPPRQYVVSMLQRFLSYISEQHLFPSGQEVLLAVSGGRDSATLCSLMHRAEQPFAIAHCNFHLRPGDCDRDEAFVRRLAQQYGVRCYVAQFHTHEAAAHSGCGIEEEAREERYAFFATTLRNTGLTCVATAHHQDDSIETFFLNLLRGTGISGLHGIRPRSSGPLAAATPHTSSTPAGMHVDDSSQSSSPCCPYVAHPMLCFSRADIDRYVQEQHLEYVEDYTNGQLDCRRNQIRLQVIPLLRQLYPGFDHTMADNIARLADVEQVYRQAVATLRDTVVQQEEATVSEPREDVGRAAPRTGVVLSQTSLNSSVCLIALKDIAALQPQRTLLFELISPYGFSATVADELITSLSHPSRQQFISTTHRMSKERDCLIIEPLSLLPNADCCLVLPDLHTQPHGILTLSSSTLQLQWTVHTLAPRPADSKQWKLPKEQACFDMEALSLPLTLRHWRSGDRFQPFGMQGMQLVSDFFTNHKFSLRQKESTWLLCAADGTILWIVGCRASGHARLTTATERSVLFTLLSAPSHDANISHDSIINRD